MTDYSDSSEFNETFKRGLWTQRGVMLTAAMDDAQRNYAHATLVLHKAQAAFYEWRDNKPVNTVVRGSN